MLSLPAVQPQPKGVSQSPLCTSSTAFPARWQPVLGRALLTSCVRRGGRCPSPGLPFPDGASLGSPNSSFPLLSLGWKPSLELPQHQLVVICPLLLWLVLNPAVFQGCALLLVTPMSPSRATHPVGATWLFLPPRAQVGDCPSVSCSWGAPGSPM